MEKKQYELCLEILRRFHESGILDHMILVGSWAVFFYKDYFSLIPLMDYVTLKTRDMDFMLIMPHKIKHAVDIPVLLEDLGFLTGFKGDKGYLKLYHPDIIVEFLVPDRGRGNDKPFSIPKLGINAQSLRFLDLLSENTIRVQVEDFYLTLPHPINFALHKLIVSQRRSEKGKAMRDKEIAIRIIRALITKREIMMIKKVFKSIHRKWQGIIINALRESKELEILEIFGNIID